MYANDLLDAYKKAKNYIQDKQIAHDLGLTPTKICNIRKGIRKLTDNEALILADGANIEREVALIACHADHNDDPRIKAIWESIAKKYNGQGLQTISMTCAAFMAGFTALNSPTLKFALCILC